MDPLTGKKRTRRGGKKHKKIEEDNPELGNDRQSPPDVALENHQSTSIAFTQESHSQPELSDVNDSSILDVAPVESDLRDYFANVETMLDASEDHFSTQEEFCHFLENVYSELDGKEIMLSADYETSRILEKLLRVSSDFQIRVFADRLNGVFADVVRHQFSSHVCQTMLTLVPEIVEREMKEGVMKAPSSSDQVEENDDTKGPEDELPSMESTLLVLCEQLDGQWMNLFTHTFASHVVRALLNVLSGQRLASGQDLRSKKSTEYNKHYNNHAVSMKVTRIPQSFRERLDSIIHNLFDVLSPKEVQSLAIHPVANPVLQMLLASPDVGSRISSVLMYDSLSSPESKSPTAFFPMLLTHKIGSHLVEKIILNATSEIRTDLYNMYLKDRLSGYIFDPIANFIVQRFVTSLATESGEDTLFKDVLATVLPIFDKIIFENRAGLAVEVLKTAIRFPSTQDSVYAALQKAFGVLSTTSEENKASPLYTSAWAHMLLYMKSSTRFKPDIMSYTAQLHGSLFLQQLLHFESNIAKSIVKSLLQMSKEEWLQWATDPLCSRVLEALFESATVSAKLKKKAVGMVDGKFCDMGCQKYASHIVDKIWTISSLEMRESIVNELFEQKNRLLNDFHGKFVYRNTKVELFRRRKDEWVLYQQGLIQKYQASLAEKENVDTSRSGKRSFVEEMDNQQGSKNKSSGKKSKKQRKNKDEIDDLFEKVLAKH